jgi:acyl-CoA thioester hydrolase
MCLYTGDMDSFRHVNNTVYFKYQETSRLSFFQAYVDKIDKNIFDHDGFHQGTKLGPILSDTFCKFKFPVSYPDKLLVGATIHDGDLLPDRYKLTHCMWSMKHKRVVAEGYGTVVSYNYSHKRVENMPPFMIEAIQAVLKQDCSHLESTLIRDINFSDDF